MPENKKPYDLEELKKMAVELVPETELRKTKDFLIGNLYLSLESSDELAQFYGIQEILRKPIKMAGKVAEELEKVSAEDIQKIAREIFQDKNLNLALIGPYKDEQEFLPLLKF